MVQLRGSMFVFNLFSSGYSLIRLYWWHFGNSFKLALSKQVCFFALLCGCFLLFLWLSMVSSATFICLILPSCDVFVTYFSITNFNFVFRRKAFEDWSCILAPKVSLLISLLSLKHACILLFWLSWLNPASSGFIMERFKFKGGLFIQEVDIWILASLGCCTTGRVL